MAQNEMAQKLRKYLKKYSQYTGPIESLDKILNTELDSSAYKTLSDEKEKMRIHRQNVLLIISHLEPGSLAYKIFDNHYLQGMSMERTSLALRYSYGYCANVESAAIKQLRQIEEVMQLINSASERAGSIPF